MRTFTEQELRELADVYFNQREDIDEMIATTDGQFFYPENKTDANNHARSHEGVTMITIAREGKKKAAKKEEASEAAAKPEAKASPEDNGDAKDITADEMRAFLKDKGVKVHPKLGDKKLKELYESNKN